MATKKNNKIEIDLEINGLDDLNKLNEILETTQDNSKKAIKKQNQYQDNSKKIIQKQIQSESNHSANDPYAPRNSHGQTTNKKTTSLGGLTAYDPVAMWTPKTGPLTKAEEMVWDIIFSLFPPMIGAIAKKSFDEKTIISTVTSLAEDIFKSGALKKLNIALTAWDIASIIYKFVKDYKNETFKTSDIKEQTNEASTEKSPADIQYKKDSFKLLNKYGYGNLMINPELDLENKINSINNNNDRSSNSSSKFISLSEYNALKKELKKDDEELELLGKETEAIRDALIANGELDKIKATGDEDAIQKATDRLKEATIAKEQASEALEKYKKKKEEALETKPGQSTDPLTLARKETEALIKLLIANGELDKIKATGDEDAIQKATDRLKEATIAKEQASERYNKTIGQPEKSKSKTATSKPSYFIMPEESDEYSNPQFSKLRFFVNPEQNEPTRTNESTENIPSENDDDVIYSNSEEGMSARLALNKRELESKNQQEMDNDALMQEYRNKKLAEESEEKKGFDLEDLLSTQEKTQAMMSAYDTLYTGISDLMGEAAANNEVMAIFSKSMALFNIGISSAEALGNAIKSAKGITAFDYAIQVATAIGVVLTNIAKAKKLLSAEKEPKAPKFASGGYVSGSGSGTSDSIPALLSNGESVLTASATSMFSPMLSAFNQLGGGIPISTSHVSSQVMGEEMLSRAFAKAVQQMPNPVVSVEEINNTNSRVQVLETYRSL